MCAVLGWISWVTVRAVRSAWQIPRVRENHFFNLGAEVEREASCEELRRQKSCLKQQQGSSLHWRNLSYEVDVPAKVGKGVVPLQLLRDVFGYATPGMLTALMVRVCVCVCSSVVCCVVGHEVTFGLLQCACVFMYVFVCAHLYCICVWKWV